MKNLLSLVLVMSAGCASQLVGPSFERFEFNKTPSPSDYPDAAGVVLLNRGTLTFTYDPEKRIPVARLRRYQRTKILRNSETSLGIITIPFDPGTLVTDVIAHSLQPDGSRFRLSGEIQEVDHPTGVRAKKFAIPGAVAGSIIEFAYDHYFNDLRFLPPWIFQDKLPTKRSEFAVILPRSYDIDYRYFEGGKTAERNPERFEVDNQTRLFWHASNLQRTYEEPRRASSLLLAPQIRLNFVSAKIGGQRFVGFSSWDDVKQWFDQISGDWTRLDPEQIDEANRITADTPKTEKALKLLTLIARDLKRTPGPPLPVYLTWIPSANTTLNDRTGNNTSRGLVLTSLLRAVGLDAYLGLVAYNDRSYLYPDFPDAQALDGVITVVPDGNRLIYLDPTQLTVSTEVPSQKIQGTRVIVLKDAHAQVTKVPFAKAAESVSKISYTLKIDRAGVLTGRMDSRFTGEEAGRLRTALLEANPTNYAKIISEFIGSRGAAIAVDNTLITDLKDLRRPLTISAQVRTSLKYADAAETNAFLAYRAIIGSHQGKMREVRRNPFRFGTSSQSEVRATLTFPSDHQLTIDAAESSAEWKHGRTELQVRKESKRRIGFKRTEYRNAFEIPPSDYRRLLAYISQQLQLEEAGIEVQRPPLKGIGY